MADGFFCIMMNMKLKICMILLIGVVMISCKEKPLKEPVLEVNMVFLHRINGDSLLLDSSLCSNEAGNIFYISEIKYFVSNVCLYRNGQKYNIGTHYMDTDYPETLHWDISSLSLSEGKYDSVSFIFGLDDNDNYNFHYVNPPQSAMAWPISLGGGYHYMMINGRYFGNNVWNPMNIHLGRGQIYQGESTDTDSIVGFVPNYFDVVLYENIYVQRNEPLTINIIMNTEKWFANPYIYDITRWGSHIMQNQTAMQILKENGKKDVFTIELKN